MDLARRARVFPDFSAQFDLGSPKRLADHRFAANGAKHEIQPCGALGFRLAANAPDAAAGRAHLDCRTLVSVEGPRQETLRRPWLDIYGRASRVAVPTRKNLLSGAGVSHAAGWGSHLDREVALAAGWRVVEAGNCFPAGRRRNPCRASGHADSSRGFGDSILPTLGREGGARRERPAGGSPAALRRHVRLERAGCRRRARLSILATRGTAE